MLDRTVHKYDVDPTTGVATLREVKPFRVLMAKGRPTVFIQAGRFYYEDGTEIGEEDVRKLGPDPEMKNGVPKHMEPAPEVLEVLGENKQDALKDFARDLKKARL